MLRDPQCCGYPPEQVRLLSDATASRAGILATLDSLAAQVGEGDTVFVFYAGHGEYGDDGYYLTTHDTQLDGRKVLTGSGLREAELIAKLRAIKAKRLLLIVNACHSGEISPVLAPSEASQTGTPLPPQIAAALLGTGEGRVIISACREQQGFLKVRGRQRTDSTHVLAAMHVLNRLECIGETLRHALHGLATVAADWVQTWVPPVWFDRYRRAGVISSEQESFVHVVDLFQTIIDIAGGHGPAAYKTDSTCLLPYLKGAVDEQLRGYGFSQFYVPNEPWAAGRYMLFGERATISDGTFKLNYQHGTYEFSELQHDSATDQITEVVINDFAHSKAVELWQVLTTPGSGYYAEVDGRGKQFPPLPLPGSQSTNPSQVGKTYI